MKYFTKVLWQQINSSDPGARLKAELAWSENDKKYAKYFEGIKRYMPKDLVRISFHDSLIKSISIINKRNKCYNCMLELEGQGKQTVIEFYDIEEFSLKIDSFNNGFSKCLTWGYEEWEVVSCKPRKFRLSVLCDIEKEFSFIFKNATIVEPKTGDGLKPLKKWVF